MKNLRISALILLIIFTSAAGRLTAQNNYPFRDKSLSIEQRLNDLVGRMTLDEKIDLLSGYHGFYLHPCTRLGIPAFHTADGPLGIASWGMNGRATAFPAALSLSASWNRDLAQHIGAMYAQECRARGIHILLSPGVNIYRSSHDARNFEYLGEDPYLTSEIVVPLVKGIQGGGVIATVKHLAGNDQEFDRYNVSTEVSERALQEIYLPPFKAAIQRAGVKAIMTAYNPLNGVYCSENAHLLKDILFNQWGFKGMVMSDWGATHSTLASALNGLDMEMGSNDWFVKDKLLPLMKEGKITEKMIDEKVRHIYGACMEMGFFDRDQLDTSIPVYNADANKAAYKEACESILLLKNEHGILPLQQPKTIAVIGPNANPVVVADPYFNVMGISYGGGGSSKVNPWYVISDFDGIRQQFPDAKILYTEGFSNGFLRDVFSSSRFNTPDGKKGLSGKYYTMDPKGDAKDATLVLDRTDDHINFQWGGEPFDEKKLGTDYFIDWVGSMTPTKTDSLYFFVNAQGSYKLWIDDKLVFDASKSESFDNRRILLPVRAGEKMNIHLNYCNQRNYPAEIRMGYAYQSDIDFTEAKRLAAQADVVVFSGGLDGTLELEGRDRPFEMPFGQDMLINALAKVNPNIVVVLHGGGGLDMTPWIDHVPAVIHTLYPGMEGGHALADILSGKVNPSAKLPFTIEKNEKQTPWYGNYDETRKSRKVYYNEGIFTGYRGYEKKHFEPLFPFGFGLSYSTFDYSDLKVNADKKSGEVKVALNVKNTSNRAGAEVVELYVHPTASKEERPNKELKNFAKIELQPGESKSVEMTLPKEAFEYYSAKKKQWVLEKGTYGILVGASSQDIRLNKDIKL
jgi:beta-glucosidase